VQLRELVHLQSPAVVAALGVEHGDDVERGRRAGGHRSIEVVDGVDAELISTRRVAVDGLRP
jgi:hypothetical protein